MTARLLYAAHRALNTLSGWVGVAAYRAAADQRERVRRIDEPHPTPPDGPLDPDGYRVDGTHHTEVAR